MKEYFKRLLRSIKMFSDPDEWDSEDWNMVKGMAHLLPLTIVIIIAYLCSDFSMLIIVLYGVIIGLIALLRYIKTRNGYYGEILPHPFLWFKPSAWRMTLLRPSDDSVRKRFQELIIWFKGLSTRHFSFAALMVLYGLLVQFEIERTGEFITGMTFWVLWLAIGVLLLTKRIKSAVFILFMVVMFKWLMMLFYIGYDHTAEIAVETTEETSGWFDDIKWPSLPSLDDYQTKIPTQLLYSPMGFESEFLLWNSKLVPSKKILLPMTLRERQLYNKRQKRGEINPMLAVMIRDSVYRCESKFVMLRDTIGREMGLYFPGYVGPDGVEYNALSGRSYRKIRVVIDHGLLDWLSFKEGKVLDPDGMISTVSAWQLDATLKELKVVRERLKNQGKRLAVNLTDDKRRILGVEHLRQLKLEKKLVDRFRRIRKWPMKY